MKTEGDEPRRIVQDRGELAVLHPVGPVYNVLYFDICPGEGNFRGGHFHKTKRDTLYVVSGRCEMRLLDLDTSELTTIELKQGDMITIGPRCAHKLVAIEFSRVVEYSLDDVNYAEDTVPYELS
jgi:mannose-6-phosphate isomerase-like protein (cupin superfamily)